MVGTIIFKDFETGSYEYMRLTFCEGSAFADIQRAEEFSTCLVSIDKRKIKYDFSVPAKKRVTDFRLFEICHRAREYLFKNEYVTIAEFCENEGSVNIRPVSTKSGLYTPVDMRTPFMTNFSNVYKLCTEEFGPTHLFRSVRCEIINYCLLKMFDIEEEVFGISGKGLYINAAIFASYRKSLSKLSLPKKLKALAKKHPNSRRAPRFSDFTIEYEQKIHTDSSRDLIIGKLRHTKIKALEYSLALEQDRKDYIGFALKLSEDSYIKEISDIFALELRDYMSNYEFCFKAKSHIDFLDVSDAMHLILDMQSAEEISAKAMALSANMKIREKVPCPDYYDSYGTAYNQI